ncbi:hypothetical protein [[Phormidium] sp. ETS-05]|uniref:hypothetical protein n=1 Tax=[Phormidium] sp. ETS-05 TaxID=222819 RepID=UPI0018EF026D|nr:hypothetical protein [[Phormidium] sp. ETS-05]
MIKRVLQHQSTLGEWGAICQLEPPSTHRQLYIDPKGAFSGKGKKPVTPETFVCPITGEQWCQSACAQSATKLHDSCFWCPGARWEGCQR